MRTSCIILVLAFTGCASAPPIVPASDWECVSPRPRAAIDAANDAALARAHAEVAVATAELANTRATVRPAVEARPAQARGQAQAQAQAMSVDAIWAPVVADQEQRKADALGRIRTATIAWTAARTAWTERHLRAAEAHVAVVEAQIQLARASYIDRHLPSSEAYETAPFRAELARVQAPYYAALADEAAATTALVAASARIASAKEEYASLARAVPTLPVMPTLESPRLRLAGFSIDRHAKPSYLKLR